MNSDRRSGGQGNRRSQQGSQKNRGGTPPTTQSAEKKPKKPLEREGFELTRHATFSGSRLEGANGSMLAFREYTKRIFFPNDRFGAAEIVIRLSIEQLDPATGAVIHCHLHATGTPVIAVPAFQYCSWPAILHLISDHEEQMTEDERPTMILSPENYSYPFSDERSGHMERFVKRAMKREGWLKLRPETPNPNAILYHATVKASILGQEQHFFKEVPSDADAPTLPSESSMWDTHAACVVEVDQGPVVNAAT